MTSYTSILAMLPFQFLKGMGAELQKTAGYGHHRRDAGRAVVS